MTLQEQISNRCVHFNGIMNDCCKAGINYESVRVDKPYKFPCLNQGGECSQVKFLTEEEVQQELKVIEEGTISTMKAYISIKDYYKKTSERAGKIPCSCGGELSYRVAASNGHIWAKCSKCDISFME